MVIPYYLRTGSAANPKNEYLYNKKELQEDAQLYDYGARFYDPVVGRFTTVDPLARNHYDLTPYNYVMNNPVLYDDEFGLDTGKVNPAPKPVMLKEVKITGTKPQKAMFIDLKSHWDNDHGFKRKDGSTDFCNCPVYRKYAGPISGTILSIVVPELGAELLGGAIAADDGINLIFNVVDEEGETIIYSTKIGDETITFGGDITKTDDVLTIKNFDVDGNLTNQLGNKNLKSIINQFGKQQGVKEVIIEGAKRTTGANPGRLPAALKFIIK